MPFTYETQRYYSFNEYISLTQNDHTDLLERKLEYAHPVDSAIIKLMDSASMKKAVEKVVETLVSSQYGLMLSTGITVAHASYPELYQILVQCCTVLGIAIPHTVITNELSGINAMTVGTDDFSFIALSNMLPMYLKEDEQKFVIAHECGHIALGHVVYHSIGSFIGMIGSLIPLVGPVLANALTLPLNAWSRCSEITADRAGLLCCRDVKTAQRALLRLIGGFTDVNNVDIDTYIDQSSNSLDNHFTGLFQEFFHKHPLIPKRLKALEYFSNSAMYYRLTNEPIPEHKQLYSDEQLNSLVNELLKVM